MKYLFLLLIPVLSFASFSLYLKNDKIAEIKNIDTIYQGYIEGNLLFTGRLLTGKSHIVYFEKGFKPHLKNSIFKEDKSGIIPIGRIIKSFKLEKPIEINSNKQYLFIKCTYKTKKTFVCKFFRQNKTDLAIYKGNIIVSKGKLISICERRTGVCLKRN